MIITPAILVGSFEKVVEQLFILEGLSERVQIDLCDGVFGLEKTWLPYEEKELPHGFLYEFDLMVVDWRKYLSRVLALSATRVIMHIDTMTEEEISEMIEMITPYDAYLGLAVSNDFPVERFVEMVTSITARYSKVFIQVMGIKKIGAQGQPFDDTVPARIAHIKVVCPMLEIQVDGSMNPETMVLVRNAGATCAVVGSYLSRSGNIKKTLDELRVNYQ